MGVSDSKTSISNLIKFLHMVKHNSVWTDGWQGTIGSLTFVKSRRYKQHVRSKRGSIKPVEINKKLQENAHQLTSVREWELRMRMGCG